MSLQLQKCKHLDSDSIQVNEEQLEALSEIFFLQKKFGSKFCDFDKNDVEYKTKWTKEFLTHISVESAELLEQLPFKHWKNYDDKAVDITEAQYEIVDIFHFFVSICLLWDLTPELLYKMYIAKNRHNHQRQSDTTLGYIQ